VILKGSQRAGGNQLAAHLLKTNENEHSLSPCVTGTIPFHLAIRCPLEKLWQEKIKTKLRATDGRTAINPLNYAADRATQALCRLP
jgi:hypothetical protein